MKKQSYKKKKKKQLQGNVPLGNLESGNNFDTPPT